MLYKKQKFPTLSGIFTVTGYDSGNAPTVRHNSLDSSFIIRYAISGHTASLAATAHQTAASVLPRCGGFFRAPGSAGSDLHPARLPCDWPGGSRPPLSRIPGPHPKDGRLRSCAKSKKVCRDPVRRPLQRLFR